MAGRGLVLTGARARFTIEGVKVMYATNVTYNENIEHLPVEVLDQYDVAENVPNAYRVGLSAQMLRIVTNPLKNRDGVRILPRLEDILNAPELTAQVSDPFTDTIIANLQGIKCTGQNVAIGARGLVFTDVQFVALRVRDESEVA